MRPAPYKDWVSPTLLREKLEEQSNNLAKSYEGWVSPSELADKLRREQLLVELKYKEWLSPQAVADRLSERISEIEVLRQELQLAKADLEQTSQAMHAAQTELQEANAKKHFDEAGDDPCKKLQYAMWQSSCYLGPIDGLMGLEAIRSVNQYFGSFGAKAPGRKYFWKNFSNLDDPVTRGKIHALCQSDLQLKGQVCSPLWINGTFATARVRISTTTPLIQKGSLIGMSVPGLYVAVFRPTASEKQASA